ncbi:translation initiation factor IF-2 N-terminal domain-containing protein [Corynebacterium sp. 22KM0430]|nr:MULTISPECIES: translation initiation factor IF-2 N-terminal domain-containing protein [unclassified Corynebacterium]WPF67296.1 translation initiation factor IF-2 N-terminal domain-containing protein [Corynebacterium sp. 22KM0430]WPF69785.1 translation initiation factor IF-2 N-terminal domain-containing protein [Corynebacterium sp. 21KM1197]
MAESAKGFDRSQLGAKTRVHALAKMMGGTSKELVGALKGLGWNKVAQSTLSPEEVTALLDHLAGAADTGDKRKDKAERPAESTAKAEPEGKPSKRAKKDKDNKDKDAEQPAESEEKIRHRVEKNVANEIHQIEEKVEKDLSEQVAQAEVAQEKERAAEENEADAQPVSEEEQEENTPVEAEVEPEQEPKQEDEEPEKPKAAKRERSRRATKKTAKRAPEAEPEEEPNTEQEAPEEQTEQAEQQEQPEEEHSAGRSRRRHRRVTRRTSTAQAEPAPEPEAEEEPQQPEETQPEEEKGASESTKRRRGRRGTRRGRGEQEASQDPDPQEEAEEPEAEEIQEPVALKGSTRLEAQRRRRSERSDEARRKRHVISQAEFLARRESVARTMVVRERDRQDHHGVVTQVGVLEDDLLVEHFVTSDQQTSMIGNIYLGRVQNVLPSMEAAFIDIGKGRNGVLYAGEVDWKAAGLGGRSRKIEQALRAGDQVLVQVTKDPVGHKGARLTTQISLAGRFLVYVPGGRSAGISRKLPGPERKRLKDILKEVVPNQGGAIIRTAAEGVSEEAIAADVRRLHDLWEDIQARAEEEKGSRGATPVTLYEEPDMLVKVVRDLFNEDFGSLVVEGRRAWNVVHAYVHSVAPDLEDRLTYYERAEHGGVDAFETYRVDEQLHKALARMVWLPSGGSLVIDRTEAMTVIDVNTGRFTGSGGNLEETVTRNNLEAAEEIVRQLRLRDLGGMIVIDFIDMVLPENRDLVLRRLKEALGRDRTRHQVSEVTSLGLVQLTRKRLGTGLLETFSTECPTCEGRGILVHEDPVEHGAGEKAEKYAEADRKRKSAKKSAQEQSPVSAVSEASAVSGGSAPKEPQRSIEELASAVVVAEPGEMSEVEKIAAAAVETADELDPHEPNGAHYEQAVAEFEASPRRQRRTRGNSRSDHRPQPEDFTAKQQQEEESAIRRRHRRRVVRRGAAKEAAEASAAVRRKPEIVRREPESADSVASRRRGRRRATRRRG